MRALALAASLLLTSTLLTAQNADDSTASLAKIRRQLAEPAGIDLRAAERRPPDFTIRVEREYFPDFLTAMRQSLTPTASAGELNYDALARSLPEGFTPAARVDLLQLWGFGYRAFSQWQRGRAEAAARQEVRDAIEAFCAALPERAGVQGC